MDFWTYLILLSAFPSGPAKSKEQRIYDRKIKKAHAFSRRSMARLSLDEQAEFDLPPYLKLLSVRFGIHEGTAHMVAQETGFFAHKGGLICQQVAPLYQKDPWLPLDEDFTARLARQYKLPLHATGQILSCCHDLWRSRSNFLSDSFFEDWKDPDSKAVRDCRAFIDRAIREGTLYPLLDWGRHIELAGSIHRTMAHCGGGPIGAVFSVFLEELSRRNMGFAAGTPFPL